MVPFEDAIAEWRDHLEARGLSLVSIKTYTTHIRSVATETRGMWPGYPDLVRWQTRQKALSKTTRHHKAKSVRCFFQWAMDMEYIGTNPARRLPVPTRAKTLPEFLSDAEMERLIHGKLRLPYRKGERWLGARDLLLTRLLVLTGLRRAEVCRLLVGDVDPQRRTLFVRAGKGDRDRTVPYPEMLDLGSLLRGRAPTEPLFVGRYEGRPLQPDAVNYIFLRKLSPIFGKRLHPHLLRHAYASYLCRRGAPIRQIQELLGHASLATTQIYLQVTAQDLRSAVSLLDEMRPAS
jgi:site-specific recombinase XerD